MARVANRHLNGTLATPNRLLRFPVVTTEPPTHVDVVSALSIACHEEIFIFPFFFLFWENITVWPSYFSRWKRTLRRGSFQRIDCSKSLIFLQTLFFYFSFIFFFSSSEGCIRILRSYKIRSWGWIYRGITEDFESRGIKSGSFVSMTKYFWIRWNLTGIFHRESRGNTRG